MVRVKVCGLTRAADVDAAVAAGADALGFIVDVPVDTPRELSASRAAELVSSVPPFVTTVLVTMPETPEAALASLDQVDADALQVHGGLDDDALARLAADLDRPLVAAADPDADAEGVDRRADVADALLVDSVGEGGGGGTGRTHDWERSRRLVDRTDAPVVLAGGLTPANVADAVETVDPFGVDVASGVEARGGEKDRDAVAAFVERAKRHPATAGSSP